MERTCFHSKINGMEIPDKEIVSSITKSDVTLNGNPVLVARHFQYRVEIIFKIVVLDGPLGKTIC